MHRDIFNKDDVAQVYGLAKGVPPPELHGLALGVAGEECVAIVMRLETGGSLESWLHGDPTEGRSAVARTSGERLRMALEVARGVRRFTLAEFGVGCDMNVKKPFIFMFTSYLQSPIDYADIDSTP